MPFTIRRTLSATVGLCLVTLLVGGCAGSQTAPPASSATRTVPPSPSNSPAAASPSASALPSPAQARPSVQPSPVAAEQPLAPETSPAGDIPDNQVFVTFGSPSGGYQLQVPEGWARTDSGTDVRFVSKLDGVQVALTSAATGPTSASAQATQVAALQRSGRAVQVNKVQDMQLPAGPAVLVDYASNSDPDPVTGKQVRLENNAYLFYQNGKVAMLTLWAPQGADNVDQWQQMAQSFRWT
jgi:hypothetical protein